MEQSYREYQIYKTQLIPFTFKSIEDEFAQELLDLWNSRNMKGSVYTAYLYSLPVGFILLQDTSRDTGMTVVIITHNQAITPMADRIIRVKNGTVSSVEINKNKTPVEKIEW